MKIAFDLDDTLFNLNNEIKKIFESFGMKYYPAINWEMSNYPTIIQDKIHELYCDPERMCSIEPFHGALDLIDKLTRLNNEVIIITARNKNYEHLIKEMIKCWFPESINVFVVGFNQSKADIMINENVEIFVDDCPLYLEEYEKLSISCIMISNKETRYNWYLRDKIFHVENVKYLNNNISLFDVINHNKKIRKLKGI